MALSVCSQVRAEPGSKTGCTMSSPRDLKAAFCSIDAAIAHAWGKAVAHGDREGRPSNTMDAFLAATAEIHHLTLVTRNAADFRGLTKSVMNPWKS